MNLFELLAFRDEFEKIAVSETYFLRNAMSTIHKTPSLKVPAQIARAMTTAKLKGFKDAEWRLGELFKEWKSGRHPSAPPKGMLAAGRKAGSGRKSYTAPHKGPVVERAHKLHNGASTSRGTSSSSTSDSPQTPPSSAPSESSAASKPKSSWKKKALMYGLPPAALAAGAYGVHRYNEKQFKKHER